MAGEAQEAGASGGLGALLGHPYDPAFCREVRRQSFDQRSKARIDKKEPVFGVIDYVHDLVIEQPWIDRVANRADPRDRVIELEMAEGVPGEGPDAVAGPGCQLQQRPRESVGAPLG